MSYEIKDGVKGPLPTDRGTGRTTSLLRQVHDMLYDEQYPMVIFVMSHQDQFRYAVGLFCHMICHDAKYSVHNARLSFRSRFDGLVHIQFVTMDDEYHRIRGLKVPIAHDHHVIEKRTEFFVPHQQQEVMHGLNSLGIDPFAQIYVFK